MNGLLELIQAFIYEGGNEWLTRVFTVFIYNKGGNERFIGIDTEYIYNKWGNQ